MDTIQSKTTSLWNRAVEATNNVAKDVATKTLDTSQKIAHTAAQQTQQWTQEATNQVVQSASQLSQSATKIAQQQAGSLAKATSESFSKASTVAQQSLQQQVSHTSQHVRHTADRLVDKVTGGGTKLIRSLGLWSLAAVFVYGVATTLPMQLIKYSMESKTTTTKEENNNITINTLPVDGTIPTNESSKPTSRWWA
jgi:F0F1-type ATP synthase membrane subunit b/b'